jgi:hypothetical protein
MSKFFFVFFVFSPFILLSQLNKAEKIIHKIQDNQFDNAYELIDKLKPKTPVVINYFLNFLIQKDIDFPNRNIDSAYFSLLTLLSEYSEDVTSDKDELCLQLQLCLNSLNQEKLKLEQEAFIFYSKDSTIAELHHFITYYDNYQLKNNAAKIIETIEFKNSLVINTLHNYRSFLITYPNSVYLKDVFDKMEELAFQACIQKNEEQTYRNYLIDYPNSKNDFLVKTKLGKLVFDRIINEDDIYGLESYLSEFNLKDLNSALNYEITTVYNLLCSKNYERLKKTSSLDSLNCFSEKFNNCHFADSIRLKIETIEYGQLTSNFSIELANNFLMKYPKSKLENEVLIRLFELEYPIYQGMEDATSIIQFRKKYEVLQDPRLSYISNLHIYTESIHQQDSYSEKKYGFIDSFDNNIKIYPIWDNVRNFSNGLAAVSLNNYWGFIDKIGNVIIPFIYEDVKDFHDGLTGVKSNGLWYVIDKNHEFINNESYSNVGEYNSGLLNVCTLASGWVYISKNGDIKSLEKKYLSASPFNSGYAYVSENVEFFIIDTNFNKVFQVDDSKPLFNNYTIYDACTHFEKFHFFCDYHFRRDPYSIRKVGDALFLNDGLVYDLKRKECWISTKVYFDQDILVFGNRRTSRNDQAILLIYSDNYNVQEILLEQNDEALAISRSGNELILHSYNTGKTSYYVIKGLNESIKEKRLLYKNSPGGVLYRNMTPVSSKYWNGRAIVEVSNKFLIIDTNGNQIGDIYDDIKRINSNLFVVRSNGLSCLTDINGGCISNQYSHIDSKIYDGAIIVTLDGKKGYINTKGIEIIKPQYTEAMGFCSGVAIVMLVPAINKCKDVSGYCRDCNFWECARTRYIDKSGKTIAGDFKEKLEYIPGFEYVLLNSDEYFKD